MLVESYRYYFLDEAGKLHSAEWFEATSDEDAIVQILAQHSDAKCEIWQGRRLVAALSPSATLMGYLGVEQRASQADAH